MKRLKQFIEDFFAMLSESIKMLTHRMHHDNLITTDTNGVMFVRVYLERDNLWNKFIDWHERQLGYYEIFQGDKYLVYSQYASAEILTDGCLLLQAAAAFLAGKGIKGD